MNRPFIVTIASEKGGVGKTTIATNLAVYLKALREDLPVTIVSFDNHFSVDQMFALGPRPTGSVADLLGAVPPAEPAVLGQYGVQYIASARSLIPPDHAPAWLRRRLHELSLDGILVLDTRPILDWFTEAALRAADLVLVPVKDRAALVNAAALREVLASAGSASRLWLLPSLIDPRARLNAEVRVHDFLRYAAAERDYQVLDISISKSPKVEGLASGFSSRIRPVLTHARNTAVHGQLKSLAEFVLATCDTSTGGREEGGAAAIEDIPENLAAGFRRRLYAGCPVCRQSSAGQYDSFFFDFRSRQRGFLHGNCFNRLLDGLDLESIECGDGLIACTLDGPGLVGPDPRLTVHLCDAEGGLVASEGVDLHNRHPLAMALAEMTGRPLESAYRELVLLRPPNGGHEGGGAAGFDTFVALRRKVARELRAAGLY